MKKLVTILAIALCSTLAMAQTNQYIWYNGNLIMGNPINQIDSITFGQLENTDSITLYLPHTIKVVHDTVIKYITIHDTINPCAVPDGAISGKFSVSPTKQVYFSKGNLMFNLRDSIWKFADNQFDMSGSNNSRIGEIPVPDVWIDAFGWSTSSTYYGVSKSSSANSYSGSFIDWGNLMGSEWYTMSNDELNYLINLRSNASSLHGLGSINGTLGMILLPDKAKGSFTSLCDSIHYYSLEQWTTMENNGAVFLPCSGVRNGGTNVMFVNQHGNYWTSSSTSATTAKEYWFENCGEYFSEDQIGRRDGQQVRLVQKVK